MKEQITHETIEAATCEILEAYYNNPLITIQDVKGIEEEAVEMEEYLVASAARDALLHLENIYHELKDYFEDTK